jgi:competence protein ComEC
MRALGFVLVGVALGVRGFLAFAPHESLLLRFEGQMVVVKGTVADDPDRRAASVRVVVAVATVNGNDADEKVLVVLPKDTTVAYGDEVAVRGKLERPEAFLTDTGRTFDYPGYLQARGIAVVVERGRLVTLDEGGSSILGTLFALKHWFEQALGKVLLEPQVSLMEGLLLGEKSGLPQTLTQAFVLTGLIHIVVLSGYNIGVVAEWTLRALGSVLPRRTTLVVGGVVIVLFALMAGGGMATTRAALMGLVAILARYLHRPAAALRALGVAVVAMLLWNPLVLLDVGFILSVLATFGLITLAPWVESKLGWIKSAAVRDVAATTIAVQLFVLPALLYFTGVLSFVSLPINVLVLPLVPLMMLLGFMSGMLALVHPGLALLPALMTNVLLGVVLWLVEQAAKLPAAAAVVPAFPAWIAVIAYLPLLYLAYAKLGLPEGRKFPADKFS